MTEGRMNSPICGLCGGGDVRPFSHAHGRDYHECATCGLIFLEPEQRLPRDAELAHYGTHQNDPFDPGYRAFLNRLAEPLTDRLIPGAVGLDYGSGPGPALAHMLTERGFHVACFDPFFSPDRSVLESSYDFVTCSETAEHFFHPGAEFTLLDRLLRPGGWLALMTEVVPAERPFESWYYVRDPTHVCFYRSRTLEWIARSGVGRAVLTNLHLDMDHQTVKAVVPAHVDVAHDGLRLEFAS